MTLAEESIPTEPIGERPGQETKRTPKKTDSNIHYWAKEASQDSNEIPLVRKKKQIEVSLEPYVHLGSHSPTSQHSPASETEQKETFTISFDSEDDIPTPEALAPPVLWRSKRKR